ncbi:hypothetical protein TrCOL_g11236 [Triparma columacea]|nr:hypothetical protein TrCOL_g11236 [Triparma columacea]
MGEKRGKNVGETCTSSFMSQFHRICHPTCIEYQTSLSSPDLPPYSFPFPRVAKCTGLGGGVFFKACEDGFYDAVKQTLVGLGVDEGGGESLEVVRERKRIRSEVKRREEEEVERIRKEEEDKRREEEKVLEVSQVKHESTVLVENLRSQAEETLSLEASKISENPSSYKIIEYVTPDGTIQHISVGGGETLDASIEKFCKDKRGEGGEEGGGREECMQDVAVFFNMFHPEFLSKREE